MTALGNKNTASGFPTVSNAADSIKSWSIPELFSQAQQCVADGDRAAVAALYKHWISYNDTHPLLHAVYFNYAVALSGLGDFAGAVNAQREAIRLNPDFAAPYINLGRLLEDRGQISEAVSIWLTLTDRLKDVNGDTVKNKITVLQQIGRVLQQQENKAALAEEALKQSLELNIAQPEVIQHYISLRQRQCKWPAIEGQENIPASKLISEIAPLSLANLIDDPIFQLARASQHNRSLVSMPAAALSRRWRVFGGGEKSKLRIGYVSSDLRDHAVGFAMTDVFEEHDRRSFDIYAYYCGIEAEDRTKARIRDSADKWVDIGGLSDEQAARRIEDDRVDILVDLNGYTRGARTRLFALQPAPIAVNWFGFPGTMGSPYHHYIIADEQIIPEGHEIFYSEKVVRLPCYQPNDRKRPVGAPVSREDENLPHGAIVYCCLNGTQKIVPEIFASWMTILSAVPNSVLWLLQNSAEINARLQALAEQRGISPERLIFARTKSNPEHLARYRLADLFLDTFPYGAHTTAADALWMGVPILTMPGRSFASRVCASIVSAAGFPELICGNLDIYVAKAIELGRNPDAIAGLRHKLDVGRHESILFNTPLLIKKLEELYQEMWEDYTCGRLPKPDLSNLDVYHDIAVRLHSEPDALIGKDVVPHYKAELAVWSEVWGLAQDQRLFRPQ